MAKRVWGEAEMSRGTLFWAYIVAFFIALVIVLAFTNVF